MVLFFLCTGVLKVRISLQHFVLLLEPPSDPIDGLGIQVDDRDHHSERLAGHPHGRQQVVLWLAFTGGAVIRRFQLGAGDLPKSDEQRHVFGGH